MGAKFSSTLVIPTSGSTTQTELLGIAGGSGFEDLRIKSLGLGAAAPGGAGRIVMTGGTVTSSSPLINATQTWNSGAVTFTGFKLNVTDTASAAGSNLLEIETGGSDRLRLEKGGSLYVSDNGSIPSGHAITDAPFMIASDSRRVIRLFAAGAAMQTVQARSNGTIASPTDIASGDVLATWLAQAFAGGSYNTSAIVQFVADGAPSGTTTPCRIEFRTLGADLANNPRWTIKNAGHLQGLSNVVLGWTASSTDSTGSPDVAVSRVGVGILGVGTGAAADASGTLRVTNVQAPASTTLNLGGGGATQVTITSAGATSITPTSGVIPLTITGQGITDAISISGGSNTTTTARYALSMSQTLNNVGLAGGGFLLNITDTNSAASAEVFRIRSTPGGLFTIDKDGDVVTDGSIITGSFIRAANGTVAAPAFAFGSDSNTGIFTRGADTFDLVTGGVSRVVLSGTSLNLGTLSLGWAAGDPSVNSIDTSIQRLGTGSLGVFGATSATGAALRVDGTGAANGQTLQLNSVSENLTLSTVGTTTDTVIDLPANSMIVSVTGRVTTTITTATSWQLGDPTTVARFTTAQTGMTAGTTAVGLEHLGATGAASSKQSSAAKVRVTTVGTPGAGAIRITIHYILLGAPTS